VKKHERLAAAFRARAGAIALLNACKCEYPAKRYETSSFHDAACPAHGFTLEMIDMAPKRDVPTFLPIEWRQL
jgi:hypothetical protein